MNSYFTNLRVNQGDSLAQPSFNLWGISLSAFSFAVFFSGFLFLGFFPSLFLFPSIVCADFQQTGPFTYQSSDERTKLVLVPTTEKKSGILMIYGKPQPFELFNPGTVDSKDAVSAFLYYDKTKRRFTEFHVKGKVYAIHESFVGVFGDGEFPRFTLNQSFSNPYFTVTNDSSALGSFSLLSFFGLTQVVNTTGRNALLYETHLIDITQNRPFKPYRLRIGKPITFGETPLTVDHVGRSFQQKSPCLNQGAVILDPSRSAEAMKGNPKDLERLARDQQHSPISIENLLLLRSLKKSFIGLEYVNKDLQKVSFLKRISVDGKAIDLCSSALVTVEE